ncbi:MAG TPA: hypothetical protein VLJ86_22630 [Ramlibacter sp.]|nr:hypothetical protein [Ramlibacter sp.]
MNFKSCSPRLVPLVFAAVTALGFPIANVAFAAPISSGSTATTGGSCTVTEGKNKGKTGTYTTEEGTGHTWCEGSWGGTDCTGGRCKDASKTISTTLPIFPTKSLSFIAR